MPPSPERAAAPFAKKSLGQHFLRDASLCRRIADLLLPGPEDHIVEIGPGPGSLTRALEAIPHASLLLLEKDARFAAERQKEAAPGTQAVLMDALRFDWTRLPPDRSWKLAGNLPYNVASPLIWDMASRCRAARRMVFMVQKEVGRRLAAEPDCGEYGALSVWVQAHQRPRVEFVIGPGAFIPPPKVDSAVLSFQPLPPEDWPRHPDILAWLIKTCFQQRRKQLGGLARRAGRPGLAEALEEAGVRPADRAENLPVTTFLAVAEILAGRGGGDGTAP